MTPAVIVDLFLNAKSIYMDNYKNWNFSIGSYESKCEDWNLAGDMALLISLDSFYKELLKKCNCTINNTDVLLKDLEYLSVRLDISNNEFQRLRNAQFIESRVYEDDELLSSEATKNVNNIPTDEEKGNSIHNIVLTGFRMVEKYYVKECASNQFEIGFILQSKDLYADRAMLCPIYSKEWNEHWQADTYETIREHDLEKISTNEFHQQSKYVIEDLASNVDSTEDINDFAVSEPNTKPIIQQQMDSDFHLLMDAPPPLQEHENEIISKAASTLFSEDTSLCHKEIDILYNESANTERHPLKPSNSELSNRKGQITKGLFDSDDSDDSEDVFLVKKSFKEYLPKQNATSFPLFYDEPPDLIVNQDKIRSDIPQGMKINKDAKECVQVSISCNSEIIKPDIILFQNQYGPSNIENQLLYDDDTDETNKLLFKNKPDEKIKFEDDINMVKHFKTNDFLFEQPLSPFSKNIFEDILNEQKSDNLANSLTSERYIINNISRSPSEDIAKIHLNDNGDGLPHCNQNNEYQRKLIDSKERKTKFSDYKSISHHINDKNIPKTDIVNELKHNNIYLEKSSEINSKWEEFETQKVFEPIKCKVEVSSSDQLKPNMDILSQSCDSLENNLLNNNINYKRKIEQSFDNKHLSDNIKTLECITKTRAKGDVNRRPSSRRGRKEALKNSMSDFSLLDPLREQTTTDHCLVWPIISTDNAINEMDGITNQDQTLHFEKVNIENANLFGNEMEKTKKKELIKVPEVKDEISQAEELGKINTIQGLGECIFSHEVKENTLFPKLKNMPNFDNNVSINEHKASASINEDIYYQSDLNYPEKYTYATKKELKKKNLFDDDDTQKVFYELKPEKDEAQKTLFSDEDSS